MEVTRIVVRSIERLQEKEQLRENAKITEVTEPRSMLLAESNPPALRKELVPVFRCST